MTSESQLGRSFKVPTSHQLSSSLLQLPTEIRLKILKLLLKKSEPLQPDTRGLTRVNENLLYTGTGEAPFALSAQLLSSCQLLYTEGFQILYSENVLGIYLRPYSDGFQKCKILAGWTYLSLWRDPAGLKPGQDLGLTFQATRELAQFRTKKHEKQYVQNLVQHYPAMLRFQRIEIDMPSCDVKANFVACRAIEELVRGKDVTLNFYEYERLPWLWCCRAWRCRSIRLNGKVRSPNIDQLVHEITCSSPPKDAFLLLDRYTLEIRPHLNAIGCWVYYDVIRQDCRSLEDAAWYSDHAEAQAALKRIMATFAQSNENHAAAYEANFLHEGQATSESLLDVKEKSRKVAQYISHIISELC